MSRHRYQSTQSLRIRRRGGCKSLRQRQPTATTTPFPLTSGRPYTCPFMLVCMQAGCRGKQPRLRARRTRTSATIPLRGLTTKRESDALGATPSVECAGHLCRGGARRAWVTVISCHRFSHCHTPCISCPSVDLASLRNAHFGTLLISDNTIGLIDFQPFLFLFLFCFLLLLPIVNGRGFTTIT